LVLNVVVLSVLVPMTVVVYEDSNATLDDSSDHYRRRRYTYPHYQQQVLSL
jgi:hypothetical protein